MGQEELDTNIEVCMVLSLGHTLNITMKTFSEIKFPTLRYAEGAGGEGMGLDQ